MSIIEKLLDQKVILISLIAIGILMSVVLLLIMIGQVTVILAKRRRQKARVRSLQIAQSSSPATRTTRTVQASIVSDSADLPNNTPLNVAKPQTVPTMRPAEAESSDREASVVTEPPSDSEITLEPASVSAAVEPDTPPPNTMQDILSSVFVDEDVVARYEVLLRGQEPVDITDLLVSCRKVLAQLRTRNVAIETQTHRG